MIKPSLADAVPEILAAAAAASPDPSSRLTRASRFAPRWRASTRLSSRTAPWCSSRSSAGKGCRCSPSTWTVRSSWSSTRESCRRSCRMPPRASRWRQSQRMGGQCAAALRGHSVRVAAREGASADPLPPAEVAWLGRHLARTKIGLALEPVAPRATRTWARSRRSRKRATWSTTERRKHWRDCGHLPRARQERRRDRADASRRVHPEGVNAQIFSSRSPASRPDSTWSRASSERPPARTFDGHGDPAGVWP